MSKVSRETEESSAKLSSGQRITKAADDAAGLAISEKMKAEIRSSKQANRNANDGVSMIQTAEGGLNETSSLLIRMKELAVQAATDTIGDSERQKTSLEYEGLKEELDRISKSTKFNGQNLLDGSGKRFDFQVGISHTSDDTVTFNSADVNSGSASLGIDSAQILSKNGAQMSLGKIDSAINKISAQRSAIGSIQNRLVSSSNNLMVYTENMSASNSRIRDVDVADEASKQARNTIVGQAGTAVLAQANLTGKDALKLL